MDEKNWRDYDMDIDFFLSPYGKNKNIKPQKINVYAIYKQFRESSKSDHLVIAANDTNEISVSFNGRSDCKVFPFDKVLYNDESQMVLHNSLLKCIVQDVVMGLNSFLIVCNLAFPNTACVFDSKTPFPEMISIETLIKNILKELLKYTKNEENIDSSLHASCFEVHDDRIVDLLGISSESEDLKFFNVFKQNYFEIKDLMEKPIVNESDISELFIKQSRSLLCYSSVCHSILTASLVKKKVSCNGFESIKVGKLTVVDFAKCKNNILGTNIFEDCALKISEDLEFHISSKNKLFDILKPAFGGNAKTSILVTLSSVLHSPDKDLSILQFVSQVQKVFNHPEVDIKLIIPTSLKEYSEEIQELQKDLNAVSKVTGLKLETQVYRYFKNSTAVENEKVKVLNSYLLSLTDSNNSKKQNLISIHATTEQVECEIKEVEKCCENLKLELKKLREKNNAKEKSSVKINEIIAMKQMRNVNEFNLKKLKLELTKIHKNYNELMHNLECLKADMVSISCDIDAGKKSLKSTLDLLITDLKNALSELQTQHEDLIKKLNNLSTIDVLIETWKRNTQKMLSKFSYFVENHSKKFDSVKLKGLSPVTPLRTFQTEIVEIIRNNRTENSPLLSCYIHKVQVFCDSSFRILDEIINMLNAIQNCYKTELKTMGSIICSSNKTLKKFFDDIGTVLKLSVIYHEELQNDSKQITDLVFFHHKFKKQFDDRFTDIKHSLLALKQSCLSHNDIAISKWNEIKKNCLKTSQKHSDFSENLIMIKKQMSSHLSQVEQKMNALDYAQLKDEAQNGESRIQQLMHIHKDIKAIIADGSELNQKVTEKEVQKVKECMNLQKINVEKYFDDYSSKIKMNLNSLLDDLLILHNDFSSNDDELKKNLDFLSSSISSLTTVYNNYQSVSSNILEKSKRALKRLPPVISVDTNDNMPGFESIYLDEWDVSSSTPKLAEKVLDVEFEKEKLLGRIKSVVEQQMSQKLNIGGLDFELKEGNKQNISTMSLPNLNNIRNAHTKAFQAVGSNLPKLKFSRKQS